MPDLAPFPVDDITLDAVEHALGGCLSTDPEHGGDPENPVLIGADYQLDELLDFLAGATGQEGMYRIERGTGERISPEDAERDDALGVDQWWIDERPHYHHNDVIRALIHEVRRLREQISRDAVNSPGEPS